MGYREKINIYVPYNIGKTLDNDAALFEIVKKDQVTINRNRFLSMLISGYYSDYMITNQAKMAAIQDVLTDCIEDNNTCKSLAEQIMNAVIIPEIPKRKGKNPKKISLKPTNETEGVIIRIIESLGPDDYVSQYFCRMLVSYCERPLYERERIVFKSNYEILKDVCLLHRTITFSTIWNKYEIHEVLAYEVVVGQDEMFNYLLCQEYNAKSDQYEARTYRLNRIDRINYSSKVETFSDAVIHNLELMKKYGAQYIINDDEEACVTLTDYGMIQFNRIYQGRPKYERIEHRNDKHYLYFLCSKDQLFFYFRRFDAEAASIVYPTSLREKILHFHQAIVNAYKESTGE